MLLAEKVVIVTGGANGMGEAISKRFATEGGQIIVVDVNREQGEKVVQEINAHRTNSAVFHQVDITDPTGYSANGGKYNPSIWPN